jgi:hypothetical protein
MEQVEERGAVKRGQICGELIRLGAGAGEAEGCSMEGFDERWADSAR